MSQAIKQIPQEINALPEDIQKELREVSKEILFQLRLTGEKFVVLKFEETMYVLPYKETRGKDQDEDEAEKEKIKYVFGRHRCSRCANFYNEIQRRLCPKVADASTEVCGKYCGSSIEAVRESKRMEKYPFIRKGVELINTPREYFVVAQCSAFREAKEIERKDYEFEREISYQLAMERKQMEREAKKQPYTQTHYKFGFKPW